MSNCYYLLSDLELELEAAKKYFHLYQSATRRKLDFDLKVADVKRLLKRKTCTYSGVVMVKRRHTNQVEELGQINEALTFDRVNPEKGYIKGNVVSCSHASNQLKNSLEMSSPTDFKVLKKLYNTLESVGFKGR